jgi:hypothetical protein
MLKAKRMENAAATAHSEKLASDASVAESARANAKGGRRSRSQNHLAACFNSRVLVDLFRGSDHRTSNIEYRISGAMRPQNVNKP